MGGANDDTEYFNGQSWEMGPKLPYPLFRAKAVIDSGGRIIITGGQRERSETLNNIILFNPEKRIIKQIEFKLKEARSSHVAILQ